MDIHKQKFKKNFFENVTEDRQAVPDMEQEY